MAKAVTKIPLALSIYSLEPIELNRSGLLGLDVDDS